MNVKELRDLLSAYPEDTKVAVHNYYERLGGELIELADGVEEGYTDAGDIPVIYIW